MTSMTSDTRENLAAAPMATTLIIEESDLTANSTWADEEEADLLISKRALVLHDDYSGSSK